MAYGKYNMKGNDPMEPKDKKPSFLKRKKKNTTATKITKKTTGISPKEQEMLSEHADHHSVKHMNQMKKDMKNGMSFTMAHKRAMNKVGK
jgi:hypothetical protein